MLGPILRWTVSSFSGLMLPTDRVGRSKKFMVFLAVKVSVKGVFMLHMFFAATSPCLTADCQISPRPVTLPAAYTFSLDVFRYWSTFMARSYSIPLPSKSLVEGLTPAATITISHAKFSPVSRVMWVIAPVWLLWVLVILLFNLKVQPFCSNNF